MQKSQILFIQWRWETMQIQNEQKLFPAVSKHTFSIKTKNQLRLGFSCSDILKAFHAFHAASFSADGLRDKTQFSGMSLNNIEATNTMYSKYIPSFGKAGTVISFPAYRRYAV